MHLIQADLFPAKVGELWRMRAVYVMRAYTHLNAKTQKEITPMEYYAKHKTFRGPNNLFTNKRVADSAIVMIIDYEESGPATILDSENRPIKGKKEYHVKILWNGGSGWLLHFDEQEWLECFERLESSTR